MKDHFVKGQGRTHSVETWEKVIPTKEDREWEIKMNDISLSSCKQKIEWLEMVNKELLEACKEAKGLLEGLDQANKWKLGNVYDDICQAIAKAESQK